MSSINDMQRSMLDGAILYAVREKVPFEGWLHFREYLTTNGCLTARQLDDEERYVLDRYVKHNSDVQLQPRSPPATPPKSPGSEPQTAACNAAPAEPLDAGLGGTFSPLIDDEKTPQKPSENLSIFLERELTWDGAGWDFCKHEDSFISTRIVERSSLEIKGDRTKLTWRFHGGKKTYRTWFIVIEDQNMVNDIMLGKNWENVESQKKENVSFGQEIEQHLTLDTPEEPDPMQRGFLAPSPILAEDIREDVEATLARLNLYSAVTIGQSRHAVPCPRRETPIRRPVEDATSDSSDSQGLHQRLGPSLSDHATPRSTPKFYPPRRPPDHTHHLGTR